MQVLLVFKNKQNISKQKKPETNQTKTSQNPGLWIQIRYVLKLNLFLAADT